MLRNLFATLIITWPLLALAGVSVWFWEPPSRRMSELTPAERIELDAALKRDMAVLRRETGRIIADTQAELRAIIEEIPGEFDE